MYILLCIFKISKRLSTNSCIHVIIIPVSLLFLFTFPIMVQVDRDKLVGDLHLLHGLHDPVLVQEHLVGDLLALFHQQLPLAAELVRPLVLQADGLQHLQPHELVHPLYPFHVLALLLVLQLLHHAGHHVLAVFCLPRFFHLEVLVAGLGHQVARALGPSAPRLRQSLLPVRLLLLPLLLALRQLRAQLLFLLRGPLRRLPRPLQELLLLLLLEALVVLERPLDPLLRAPALLHHLLVLPRLLVVHGALDGRAALQQPQAVRLRHLLLRPLLLRLLAQVLEPLHPELLLALARLAPQPRALLVLPLLLLLLGGLLAGGQRAPLAQLLPLLGLLLQVALPPALHLGRARGLHLLLVLLAAPPLLLLAAGDLLVQRGQLLLGLHHAGQLLGLPALDGLQPLALQISSLLLDLFGPFLNQIHRVN
mmetsp:Transcript_16224/g.24606  ORF Transcript_16224/g.24606 Transcript_16224/m.24606 type:complete len:422 (-) Transcript_16224:404-1669(-)